MHLPARCALRIALAVSFLFLFAIQISFKTEAQEQQSKEQAQKPGTVETPAKTDAAGNPSTQQKMGSELDGPVIVNTDLITLTVTVTDTYGRYVSGLSKKAFTILDEKQPQEITYFSDDDSPVSVGVIFDVSGSMSGEKIKNAREALSKFIQTSHNSDEYFLIAFNSRAQLLLDKTRDGNAVLDKLTFVQTKNNTALYDACYLGVEKVQRGLHPKR
ncbi:MAG TPA: VWA domain-containing protein, partial [Pyrinomonadaceae bacterium]|nr:VWA domain-containing protein [Pyrinomonadaceae bacterium]